LRCHVPRGHPGEFVLCHQIGLEQAAEILGGDVLQGPAIAHGRHFNITVHVPANRTELGRLQAREELVDASSFRSYLSRMAREHPEVDLTPCIQSFIHATVRLMVDGGPDDSEDRLPIPEGLDSASARTALRYALVSELYLAARTYSAESAENGGLTPYEPASEGGLAPAMVDLAYEKMLQNCRLSLGDPLKLLRGDSSIAAERYDEEFLDLRFLSRLAEDGRGARDLRARRSDCLGKVQRQYGQARRPEERRRLHNQFWHYYRWPHVENFLRPAWKREGRISAAVSALRLNNEVIVAVPGVGM